jgi:hypothetical protein
LGSSKQEKNETFKKKFIVCKKIETFFVSLKQIIWNVSKFGSDKISLNVIQITNIEWLNDCKFCTICFKVNNC